MGRYLRRERDPVISHRYNVAWYEAEFPAGVAGERAGNDDVAVVMCREFIGAISLKFLAELRSYSIPEARLKCSVLERRDLDGLFTGSDAGNWAQVVARATANHDGAQGGNASPGQPHFISPRSASAC